VWVRTCTWSRITPEIRGRDLEPGCGLRELDRIVYGSIYPVFRIVGRGVLILHHTQCDACWTRVSPLAISPFIRLELAMASALVTRASRGVGRGVAIEPAAHGFHVFAIHCTYPVRPLLGQRHGTAVPANRRTRRRAGRCGQLRLGGYEKMVEDGQFTWNLPFWKQPRHGWNSMMEAGVRFAFVTSAHAAGQMVARRRVSSSISASGRPGSISVIQSTGSLRPRLTRCRRIWLMNFERAVL
jgi:hypothetical protein